ncbi:MAG: hypothetical protein WDO73_16150 [Ignavibacteriota bacterium]
MWSHSAAEAHSKPCRSSAARFYAEPEPDAIAGAIARLESMEATIRPLELQAWARQFSEDEFLRRMSPLLKVDSAAPAENVDSDRRGLLTSAEAIGGTW